VFENLSQLPLGEPWRTSSHASVDTRFPRRFRICVGHCSGQGHLARRARHPCACYVSHAKRHTVAGKPGYMPQFDPVPTLQSAYVLCSAFGWAKALHMCIAVLVILAIGLCCGASWNTRIFSSPFKQIQVLVIHKFAAGYCACVGHAVSTCTRALVSTSHHGRSSSHQSVTQLFAHSPTLRTSRALEHAASRNCCTTSMFVTSACFVGW
jgi:hypothetical protein